jgi:tRNASer (uridine44-2'-O)-methyltransferase
MRERHKHLVNDWREVTDPLKHVFEVRRFLPGPQGANINTETRPSSSSRTEASRRSSCFSGKSPTVPRPSLPIPFRSQLQTQPWCPRRLPRTWNQPRPLGGFVDLGCGNSLLARIPYLRGPFGVRHRPARAHILDPLLTLDKIAPPRARSRPNHANKSPPNSTIPSSCCQSSAARRR